MARTLLPCSIGTLLEDKAAHSIIKDWLTQIRVLGVNNKEDYMEHVSNKGVWFSLLRFF